MHCEELTDDVLLDCAERRVQGPALEVVERHLAQCKPCAERYLETAQIFELAGASLKVTPSAAVDARILADLDAQLSAAPARRRRLIPALATATAFLFAGFSTFGVLSLQPRPMAYLGPQYMKPESAPAKLPEPSKAAATVPPLDSVVALPENNESPAAPASLPSPMVKVLVTPLVPDLNGDGKVDVADLMLLMQTMNEDSPVELYDLNGDGKVDVADKMLLAQIELK
jgi:anti-sigma factor RsiW